MSYDSISPAQLAEKINGAEKVNLIDVRELVEYEMARIEGAKLLPLSRFQEWIDTLEHEDELIIMCHHGVRSGQVCAYLMQNGFEKVWNLTGGIDAWSTEIDRAVPRY